jgi:alcohol dehydrogenase (cytochrome c)
MSARRPLCPLILLSVTGFGQAYLDPAKLLQPPTDTWPTYNGDYSGRRYSTLTRINQSNINSLALAWVYRANPGREPQGGGGNNTPVIKGTPIEVNGVLYLTIPDHAWAMDARTGREIWHYAWPSKGGWHIGNRGAAAWRDTLYFETPDCYLVALNMADGKERWHAPICDLEQFYYASVAPVIVKNHVITGVSGDDLDIPGYIESHSAETGALEWRWYAHPEPGTPEAKTWPSVEAMMHGGGMTWVPSTYDPELNLIYFGTGNPQPVIAGQGRAGSNLYTECIVARGISSRLRMTRTIGTRSKRPCCSTARSTGNHASSWRRPAATGGSLCWIAPPASASSVRNLYRQIGRWAWMRRVSRFQIRRSSLNAMVRW